MFDLERITLDRPADTWWDRYVLSLEEGGLTQTARQVINDDAEFIVDRCIFGDGTPAPDVWPSTQSRKGLVMGAVQSGKTASMLAVIAKAIDRGVDLVVVLAGTRRSLWQQTYERLHDQFRLATVLTSPIAPIVKPTAITFESESPLGPGAKIYNLSPARFRRARNEGAPVIVVVMKEVHHLRQMTRIIEEVVCTEIDQDQRPAHLLVIDDEADDGSILDAQSEQHLHLDDPARSQIPPAIVNLWSRRSEDGPRPKSEFLYATYVGYTATPQANFLQASQNPLAPTHFVTALRTPYDQGALNPRSETFTEPDGLAAYYTGGEIFYRRLGELKICSAATDTDQKEVARALRAYLVAGAIKLFVNSDRKLPSEAATTRWDSGGDAKRQSPLPHSMLIHTSAEKAQHFEVARSIIGWAFNPDGNPETTSDSERHLPRDLIKSSIERDPDSWIEWLDTYSENAARITQIFNLAQPIPCPDRSMWPEIRRLILDEVAPHTNIAVINSDEDADPHPNFKPIETQEGWYSRENLFSIFVSGNVMSRGLTIEGLTTTYFTRPGANPAADTRMQMQRWFGYRGSEIHLCKVILNGWQLDRLNEYHDTDVFVRKQILREMARSEADNTPFRIPTVLRGKDWLATAKVQNRRAVPLCAGPYPFITMMNSDDSRDPNLDLVINLFQGQQTHAIQPTSGGRPGILRGVVLQEKLDLLQAADLLDALHYDAYVPSAEDWNAERWAGLYSTIFEEGEPSPPPFFRPPEPKARATAKGFRQDCPYNIAAYFRLWDACTTHHANGLVDTSGRNSQWNLVDLDRKSRLKPKFHVGIRFGRGASLNEPAIAGLGVRMMDRKLDGDELDGTWGTRNQRGADPGDYFGDQRIDFHLNPQLPQIDRRKSPWRPEGSPGLILFHIVQRNNCPTVAVGVGIPLGGPDHIAVPGGDGGV